jgi:exopolysaccharide production protein ExoQ
MSPSLALLLWLFCVVPLLCFDPARDSKTSLALWIPVLWIFIVGSRLPSQWMGGSMGQVSQALEEGNPLDRVFYFSLIVLSIGILMSRSFRWGAFLRSNWALTAFLLFSLLSVCWSDFAFVALKRWFRDLGNYLVVLVVLTDPNPAEAVRSVLRRTSYLLIPLSVVLIKYYSDLGRHYSEWTGATEYVGVTTGKNLLGVICVISGLFFLWDLLSRWPTRKTWRTRKVILVNLAFMGMTLWLLNLASSATSRVCILLGGLVIVAAQSKTLQRRPGILKALMPALFCIYLVLAFGLDMSGTMAGAVGKDPTLTDRTKIWAFLLSMRTNPLIGTGYESFWMGSRLQWFAERSGLGALNEAHNGYLEIYLNLGAIGVLLLLAFVMTGYRNIWSKLGKFAELRPLLLALWIIFLFYNVTEASFRSGLMWSTFLLGTLAVPRRVVQRLHSGVRLDETRAEEPAPARALETVSLSEAKSA